MLLFNTVIALFLFVLFQNDFFKYFIYAQSIGLSIFLSTYVVSWVRPQHKKSLITSLVAIPVGTLIGISVGSRVNGDSLTSLVAQHPQLLVTSLAAAVIFGSMISYYFFTRAEIAESHEALENETRLRSEQQRQTFETQLKLLQAQIEPHFLFNTLSNVLSLIDNDQKKAKHMLTDLTHYLRASLQRTREEVTTLADEIALLDAYLSIQSIRMGDRLTYNIVVADSLLAYPLPPLLLQPLVENAIKHGIEPEIEGGEIHLHGYRQAQTLILEVSDTGHGLDTHVGPGIGLANVRERLRNIYQDQAQLQLFENPPKGVKAKITLPWLSKISTESSVDEVKK